MGWRISVKRINLPMLLLIYVCYLYLLNTVSGGTLYLWLYIQRSSCLCSHRIKAPLQCNSHWLGAYTEWSLHIRVLGHAIVTFDKSYYIKSALTERVFKRFPPHLIYYSIDFIITIKSVMRLFCVLTLQLSMMASVSQYCDHCEVGNEICQVDLFRCMPLIW